MKEWFTDANQCNLCNLTSQMQHGTLIQHLFYDSNMGIPLITEALEPPEEASEAAATLGGGPLPPPPVVLLAKLTALEAMVEVGNP